MAIHKHTESVTDEPKHHAGSEVNLRVLDLDGTFVLAPLTWGSRSGRISVVPGHSGNHHRDAVDNAATDPVGTRGGTAVFWRRLIGAGGNVRK